MPPACHAGTVGAVLEIPAVRRGRFAGLTPAVLYGILKLRSDIFVVEQNCVYMDMDGRDTEPATQHLWIEDETGAVIATLRILDDGDGLHHVGRVVTRADQRRRGLSALLVRAAIDLVGPPIEIKAQAHLSEWYGRFGFVRCSDEWIEDGIPHVQMRLGA